MVMSKPKAGFIGGAKTRILVCDRCKSIDHVPMFHGDVSKDVDVLMEEVVERHQQSHGTRELRMGGVRPEMRSYTVPLLSWEDPQQQAQIIEKVRQEHGHTGVGKDEYYQVRDQYREDALSCFRKHGSPGDGDCPDYMTHKMRIGNPTISRADEKAADADAKILFGVARGAGFSKRMKADSLHNTKLCQWCPVHFQKREHVKGY